LIDETPSGDVGIIGRTSSVHVNVSVARLALYENDLPLPGVSSRIVDPTGLLRFLMISLNQSPLKVILVEDFPLGDVGIVGSATPVEVDGLVGVSEDDVVIAVSGVFETDLSVALVDAVPQGDVSAFPCVPPC